MNRRHHQPEPHARRAYVLGAASAALAVAAIVACTDSDRGQKGLTARGEATGAATAALPDIAAITSLPTGPMAGAVIDSARYAIHNPYDGNGAAIEDGQQLFIHMNCAYCHGFNGGGGMGPSLQGQTWRFGGDDADVFKTIYGGRGKGMPAWGSAITEDNIWKIVAYVRTLGTKSGAPAAAPLGRAGTGVASSDGTREPMKSVNEW